jgi:hypothetical protein
MTIVRFAAGVRVAGLLTAENTSPVGDDVAPCLVPVRERGFHGSRMAVLAERVGVNIGHMHHYFESKEPKNDVAN